jgi:hypothetical protein
MESLHAEVALEKYRPGQSEPILVGGESSMDDFIV